MIQVLLAFLGTMAFSVLFNIPSKEYVFCGITSALGWFCYLAVYEFVPSASIAAFIAAFVLTCSSRVFAVYRKNPVTIFLLAGTFPLVPGSGIYYTAYNLVLGNNSLAATMGIEAFKIAIAISLGILIAFSFPNSIFKLFDKKLS